MPLTHDPIGHAGTEKAAILLLDEWLRRYFTGTPVTVSGDEVTLPVCEMLFNQVAQPPHDTSSIHCIFSDIQPQQQDDGDQKLISSRLTMTFYVRAPKPDAGRKTADFLCVDIADALKRLFETETKDLAAKGLRQIRIRRGPSPIATVSVATRMLAVSGIIQYNTAY